MKRKILYIVLLCFVVNMAYAVIATPDPVLRQLPDGSWQEVYMHGDEHFHYLTTLSGERLEGTEVGDSAAIVAAKRITIKKRLSSYVPVQGKVYVPVLLVNFADVHFTMDNPVENWDDFYNGSGGTNRYATGSVRDYYLASSDSLLDLEFEVYGPFTLSKNMDYYGSNESGSHMRNMDKLLHEAARLAVESGIDFQKYDNDNDGYIDNLSIVSAGYNEAEGGAENTIWPHYSQVYGQEKYSGKQLSGYLIISEYRGSGGKSQAGIGTYCHEFGHALGLPDLYDTQQSDRYTVGEWDVMCSGSYNNSGCTPPTFSAFERFALGWLTPIQLQGAGDYRLKPLLESNEAYLVAMEGHNMNAMSPSPSEYFLLENRQKVGWDAHDEALVGSGMLISHITFNQRTWDRNTFNNGAILGYAIVGAYDKSPSQSTPLDVFPGNGNVAEWLPTLNSGAELVDQRLMNIREMSDRSIYFSYGPLSDDGIFFSNENIPLLVTTYDKGIVTCDTAKVDILVKNMPNDTLVMYATNSNFVFSLDSGATWYGGDRQCKHVIPNDTAYSFPIMICHSARRQNCNVVTGFITVESALSMKMKQLELQGTAPRPIYITSPEVLAPNNISSTSVTAHWLGQADAEYYYVTLFSLQEGQQYIEKQDFQDFGSDKSIRAAGWSANFVRMTPVVAESGNAVLFSRTDEQLVSEEYLLPPVAIRFWLSNNYVSATDGNVGGSFLLEGKSSHGSWVEIDKIRVINTTKNLVKNYSLQVQDSLVQFRLTYTHKGGEGGAAIDGFEAHYAQGINYVCSGTEREYHSSITSAIFHNLEPNTTYYFAVQAYEDKGCEEHYSKLSKLQAIKTLSTDDVQKHLDVYRDADGKYVVILPETADGLSDLYIYTAQGNLVLKVDIPYEATKLQLPDLPGTGIYFIKQVTGSMKRKGTAGKFYYSNQ